MVHRGHLKFSNCVLKFELESFSHSSLTRSVSSTQISLSLLRFRSFGYQKNEVKFKIETSLFSDKKLSLKK